ncbi:sodium:potassium:calcium exchanger [Plakobranchus ocellatus]|uniref:Sodium:potassium:calcium exchanger n=1 Tax=Plakobranchus ocellatus TaxID=259542 RepID=A0AAV3YDI0_9GAST|nr:sodium:potassium:calcium exchanger [Plakobranchus ocellatus]
MDCQSDADKSSSIQEESSFKPTHTGRIEAIKCSATSSPLVNSVKSNNYGEVPPRMVAMPLVSDTPLESDKTFPGGHCAYYVGGKSMTNKDGCESTKPLVVSHLPLSKTGPSTSKSIYVGDSRELSDLPLQVQDSTSRFLTSDHSLHAGIHHVSKDTTASNNQARWSSNCQSNDVESCSSSNKSNFPWRHKGRRRIKRLSSVLLVYAVGVLALTAFRVENSKPWYVDGGHALDLETSMMKPGEVLLQETGSRFRRDVRMENGKLQNQSHNDGHKNCTPRSVGNFPKNFLNFHDTQNGGFILNVLIAMYMFAALAIVCDDYFVPALEHICEDLGLQADVAGATFMAAGSSAPEFMTSVVGVFFAQSDVGVGTIVGSAVFNILFIIGVCGVFAGMVVELTWYPLVRDTLFYLLSVLTLFLVIKDQEVTWYEAVLMVLLYLVYIVLMYFNRFLESSSIAWVTRLAARLERQPLVAKPPETHVIPEEMKRARAHSAISKSHAVEKRVEWVPMTKNGYTRFEDEPESPSSRISQSSMSMSMSREYEKPAHPIEQTVPEEQETAISRDGLDAPPTPSASSSKNGELMTVSEYESVWTFPDTTFQQVIWIVTCPIKAAFFVTIPDSRRPGIWAKLYLVSFVMSVAWISGLTYIMVWMVTVAGDALDIPDTVMGLTILAAGTSVPDCLASVFVARDGYGDMAVSNSLGSNVFDILLCLGVPWLIESAINSGKSVEIVSEGLTYSSLTLLATVIFLLVSMGVNKWKLNKGYGLVCLLAYVLVITVSCLYELNVFGDFNPPSCPR